MSIHGNSRHGFKASGSDASGPNVLFLLRIARGYSCMFWGLVFLVVTYTQGIGLKFHGYRMPLWYAGVALMAFGVIQQYRTRRMTAAWGQAVSRTTRAHAAALFFVPFLSWWQTAPHNDYLLINVVLLYLSGFYFLYCLNRSSSLLGRLVKDPTIQFEGSIASWFVVVLAFIPGIILLLLTGILIAGSVFAEHGVPADSLNNTFYLVLRNTSPWVIALPLLPVSLTLVILWRAKESCFLALRGIERMGTAAVSLTPEEEDKPRVQEPEPAASAPVHQSISTSPDGSG